MKTNTIQGSLVVLDFETSGMSPERGDRAIEIGAVRLEGGHIVESFQSLMNPGRRINSFIENYTGISNAMLEEAPEAAVVMERFAEFIADSPLVAHNASFDRRFLDAELAFIGRKRVQEFGCSLLVARRVYPDAPNHKLETLVRYKGLPCDGRFHRALADSRMTAHLWQAMTEELKTACDLDEVPFEVMQELGKVKKDRVPEYLRRLAVRAV